MSPCRTEPTKAFWARSFFSFSSITGSKNVRSGPLHGASDITGNKKAARLSGFFCQRAVCLVARGRIDRHLLTTTIVGLELHDAIHQGEERIILATADVAAGVELGAALTDQNVAGDDVLATEPLDAEALRVRIATVAARADSLFMCHFSTP